MGIRDFLDRLRSKRSKYKQYEEEMKIQETYYERKKSANERELERYHSEERERAIKAELEKYRNRDKHEIQYGHQILNTKNMYKNEKPIMLKSQKKMFSSKSNLNTPGGLFFK